MLLTLAPPIALRAANRFNSPIQAAIVAALARLRHWAVIGGLGVLVIDPKVKGDIVMNTAKSYAGDVVIRFEFKPGEGCNNDLLFRGTKFDLKKEDVKNIKFGEWNRFEISIQGEKAEFRCNGELLKTLKAKPAATPLGLRAEFGPVEYRNLRIKTGS